MISSVHTYPNDLFLYKNIVVKYGPTLRSFILNDLSYINIALTVYEQNYTDNEKMYLPAELSSVDISNYIEKYINSERPNINILKTISIMRSDDRFKISDEIRYKAKERYERESKIIFENSVKFEQGFSVAFSSNTENEKNINKEGTDINLTYSLEWLQDTLDYPSILNNFIYLFEFVDVPQMRSLLVARQSDAGILEFFSTTDSKRYYPENHTFNIANRLALMQMTVYYDFLEKNGIRYENVLEWFFTKYLQEEFNCSEIRVSFPTEKTSFSEKCSVICDAFEAVLKQFDLYVKNKDINFELLKMSSGSKRIGDVPSLIDAKYIYGEGKDYNAFKYYMFSNQCLLLYLPRITNNEYRYNCFYELIKNERIYLTDYRDNDQNIIKYLKDNELISIDQEDRILPGNVIKLAILRDLSKNDFISKWHYPSETYPIIDDWIDKHVLCSGDTLLSKQETAYYDYLLNRVEFVNGLDIRNKYKHGNQHGVTDMNEHKQNYMIFLVLFTTLAIKINDDFCLFQSKGDFETD